MGSQIGDDVDVDRIILLGHSTFDSSINSSRAAKEVRVPPVALSGNITLSSMRLLPGFGITFSRPKGP